MGVIDRDVGSFGINLATEPVRCAAIVVFWQRVFRGFNGSPERCLSILRFNLEPMIFHVVVGICSVVAVVCEKGCRLDLVSRPPDSNMTGVALLDRVGTNDISRVVVGVSFWAELDDTVTTVEVATIKAFDTVAGPVSLQIDLPLLSLISLFYITIYDTYYY